MPLLVRPPPLPPPNNPPQAHGQSITTETNAPKEITLDASDPDAGDILTLSIINWPQNGVLSQIDSQGRKA